MRSVRQIAIYGSCVSRDTAEFLEDCEVITYVARQSAIVSGSSFRGGWFDSTALPSAFQRQMVDGDQSANVLSKLLATKAKVVLIDLVDERNGVWKFPSGRFLTNSIEAQQLGIQAWAIANGASLIPFGSDDHFNLWKHQFLRICQSTRAAGKVLFLLDIPWAALYPYEQQLGYIRGLSVRARRQIVRNVNDARLSIVRGEALTRVGANLFNRTRPDVDRRIRQAANANDSARRYVEFASQCVDYVVCREPSSVRRGRDHKWGVAPFHYDRKTYESVATEIDALSETFA